MPRWTVVVAVLAAVGGLLSAAAPPAPAAPGVAIVRLDGRGHGHGVGLSQRGAEHLAREGRTAWEILQTFYPGTQPGEAGGHVRVAVHRTGGRSVTLAFPQGGEVRSGPAGEQPAGFPLQVPPGGQVRVWVGDGYAVEPLVLAASPTTATPYRAETPHRAEERPCMVPVVCPPAEAPTTTTTTAPPATGDDGSGGGAGGGDGSTGGGGDRGEGGDAPGPVPGTDALPAEGDPVPAEDPGGAADAADAGPSSLRRSAAPVWAVPVDGGATTVLERGRTYRGALEAVAADGGLRILNQVDVETYLAGMAEVPATWPAAAVQAQAVAARTYALRAMRASGEICDDERCQVYVGVDREHPDQTAAVEATRGQVLTYGGELAAAVYSADAGGVSATTAEGFGTPDGAYPYLTTVHYGGPVDQGEWGTEIALADVGARVGYPGAVGGVEITDVGPSGRALAVTVHGDAGPVEVDGRRFASAMGLRSTLFTAAIDTAGEAPEAPAPVELQALPEVAGATAAAPRSYPSAEHAGRAGMLTGGPELLGSMRPDLGDADARRRAGQVALLLLAAVTALGLRVGGHQPLPATLVGPSPGSKPSMPWEPPPLPDHAARWSRVGGAALRAAAADLRRGAAARGRGTLRRWTNRGR